MDRKTLTGKQVAETYGFAEGSLANMRCRKEGPKYFKVGKKVFYRPKDVEAWLFANPVLTIDSVGEG